MKFFLFICALAVITRAADDPETTAQEVGQVVAGPKDVELQVTNLDDSISVAVEGKNDILEDRKIMAKVGSEQVEEHMERVKKKMDDEKLQGSEVKMQVTYPSKAYVKKRVVVMMPTGWMQRGKGVSKRRKINWTKLGSSLFRKRK